MACGAACWWRSSRGSTASGCPRTRARARRRFAATLSGAEAIANARTVKAFANEKYESRRYDRALARWYALCTTQAYVTGGYYALVYSFCSQLLVPAALLAYGSELVLAGEMPAERLVAAMLYQQQLQEYVGNLLDAVTSMYKSSGAASAAFALIDRRRACARPGTPWSPTSRGR